jgi:hypothetical protein
MNVGSGIFHTNFNINLLMLCMMYDNIKECMRSMGDVG